MAKQNPISGQTRDTPGGSSTASDHSNEDERPFSEMRKNLQDILRMVSLHRWAFFIPCCLVTSGAFILSLYYPRTYKAVTTFERRADPVLVNLPVSSTAESFEYFRSTMSRDLVSVQYLTDVVANLALVEGLERTEDGTLTPESRQRCAALARSLNSNLNIRIKSPNPHVDLIWAEYRGRNPHIGTKLLDEMKNTYIRRTLAWIEEFLESQRTYVQKELDEATNEVKLAQRELTQLRLETPYVDPQSPGSIATQLSQYEIARNELTMRQREYKTELAAMEQLLASLAPQVVPGINDDADPEEVQKIFQSPITLGLLDQLQKIESKVTLLRKTRGMTYEHPEIKQLMRDRGQIEEELAVQQGQEDTTAFASRSGATRAVMTAAVNPAAAQPQRAERTRLSLQIDMQKAKLKEIEIDLASNDRALAELKKAKNGVFKRQDEFTAIVSRFDKAKQRQTTLTATLSQIEPALRKVQQGRLVQFSPGQPARGTSVPVSPKAKTIVILAVLAGLASGTIFVILAEVVDHVYHSSGQVATSLGLPILDNIDEIITTADRRRSLIRRTVIAPAALACCLGLAISTGSLAYLSVQRPWTYQKIKSIPDKALHLLGSAQTDAQEYAEYTGPETPPPQ
ncbi:MAG: hypothetical protein JSU63_02500 [Phycisphaerales bacterium]|nr:MAG: hypothetical protein JSU63_02500 [Phycisphaerales bacterium]